MDLLQTGSNLVLSSEGSLVLGLIISGLFYLQYSKLENELKRQDMIDNFLKD